MAKHHKADVLIMCGDLTGKALVPIIEKKSSEWLCMPFKGEGKIMHSESEVREMRRKLHNRGYYTYVCSSKEFEELKNNPGRVDKLFVEVTKESIQRWLSMLEKVEKNVEVIVAPGNDDTFEINEIIKKNDRATYPLEKVIQLNDKHEMISCEWTNPSPWNTPRECSEEELLKKLEKEFARVEKYENLICYLHAPPYGTQLDIAPQLDENLKPKTFLGSPVMAHVGSRSVKKVVEKYQPLLGFHGHIHESCAYERLGRTLCLNPGSEYESGILRGYVVDIRDDKIEFWRVEA
jgi:Icc-related predicted phosphoesterase